MTDPPLTTIDQPFGELVRKAMEMVEIPVEQRVSVSLPARPVIRRSCGSRDINCILPHTSSLLHNSNNPLDYLHAQNLQELHQQLSILLADMEMDNFFIIRYENETSQYGQKGKTPQYSCLVYSWRKGRQEKGCERQLYETEDILFKTVAVESPFSYVIKPLFIDQSHYGLMVCDTKIGYEEEMETIKGVIRYTMKIQLLIEEMDRLTGLLPICSSCHSIRDDKGYWSRVEEYVSKRTDACFTHTVCPRCAEELYGKDITQNMSDNFEPNFS